MAPRGSFIVDSMLRISWSAFGATEWRRVLFFFCSSWMPGGWFFMPHFERWWRWHWLGGGVAHNYFYICNKLYFSLSSPDSTKYDSKEWNDHWRYADISSQGKSWLHCTLQTLNTCWIETVFWRRTTKSFRLCHRLPMIRTVPHRHFRSLMSCSKSIHSGSKHKSCHRSYRRQAKKGLRLPSLPQAR